MAKQCIVYWELHMCESYYHHFICIHIHCIDCFFCAKQNASSILLAHKSSVSFYFYFYFWFACDWFKIEGDPRNRVCVRLLENHNLTQTHIRRSIVIWSLFYVFSSIKYISTDHILFFVVFFSLWWYWTVIYIVKPAQRGSHRNCSIIKVMRWFDYNMV